MTSCTILGLSGGLNRPDRSRFSLPHILHDAAAVVVRDGEVIAAVEEERLNRIKHSNCFATLAIRECLRLAKIVPAQLDAIANGFGAEFLDYQFRHYFLEQHTKVEPVCTRSEMRVLLAQACGETIRDVPLVFVDHHLAHAASAYYTCDFDEALVAVIDGMGENVSLSLYTGSNGRLQRLLTHPIDASLGIFYLTVISTIGFCLFDEYKVMGLAPYGDAARYRELLLSFYELRPNGGFELHTGLAEIVLGSMAAEAAEAGNQDEHCRNVAAALQEALEKIVLHVLDDAQERTGLGRLCLAGGVAQNSAMNGRIQATGRFQRVWIPPFAHDAGTALGAALVEYRKRAEEPATVPLSHAYLGRGIPRSDEIAARLMSWQGVVTAERLDDPARAAAALLAEGQVLGWVQGRSEFGPRALGNRSIVADSRPASHRELINAMIKRREAFRPFAPATTEEDARNFFDLALDGQVNPYMTATVTVRPEYLNRLAATTHVDGTARLQTVSRALNPRFWSLIRAFGDLTDLPVILNTSFNSNAEPIVDSLDDALTCFVTTGLDALVLDDHFIRRTPGYEVALEGFRIRQLQNVDVEQRQFVDEAGRRQVSFDLFHRYRQSPRRTISEAAHAVLSAAEPELTLREALDALALTGPVRMALRSEILALWQERLIVLSTGND